MARATASFKIRPDRRFTSVVATGVIVCLVIYLAVLSPFQHSAAHDKSILNSLRQEDQQLQQRENEGSAGGNSFTSLYQKDLLLDALLPDSLSESEVFTNLSNEFTAAGLTIDNFASVLPSASSTTAVTTTTDAATSGSTAPTTTLPPASSTGAVTGATSLQFAFSVTGTLTEVKNWAASLYAAPHTLTTTANIKMTLGDQGYTGSTNVNLGDVALSGTIFVWSALTPALSTSTSSSSSSSSTTQAAG